MKRLSAFRQNLVRLEEVTPPFLDSSGQVIVVVTYNVPGSTHGNVSWDTSHFRALRRAKRLHDAALPDLVKKALK